MPPSNSVPMIRPRARSGVGPSRQPRIFLGRRRFSRFLLKHLLLIDCGRSFYSLWWLACGLSSSLRSVLRIGIRSKRRNFGGKLLDLLLQIFDLHLVVGNGGSQRAILTCDCDLFPHRITHKIRYASRPFGHAETLQFHVLRFGEPNVNGSYAWDEDYQERSGRSGERFGSDRVTHYKSKRLLILLLGQASPPSVPELRTDTLEESHIYILHWARRHVSALVTQ